MKECELNPALKSDLNKYMKKAFMINNLYLYRAGSVPEKCWELSWILGLDRISGRIPDIEIIQTDIQPYPTKIIRPDIIQFNLLYQTTLIVSGRISSPTLPDTKTG